MVARVHLDREVTWPEELAGFVERAIDRIRVHDLESNEVCELRQLDASDLIEDDFAQSCSHIKVACFHATRLLEHEIKNIRAQGLLVLDDDLRRRKLQLAIDHHPDLLTPTDAELIFSTGPNRYQRGPWGESRTYASVPSEDVKRIWTSQDPDWPDVEQWTRVRRT